ncbi:diguanylate cyclase domain-containing protein [Paractinoplanes bogorensis]|uniref:diguanylate cyclase domain-containing protein n=1 Tax=Paractinoplanes bogorensis TaxID=1610840 RepID=UPI001C04263E|nr:diguanylate cyclase [Actinoplanes bogorensis]
MILLGLVLVGGAGWLLTDTVARSQTEVLQEFDTRAEVSAAVIASALGANDAKTREFCEAAFAGTAAEMARTDYRAQFDVPEYAIITGDGKLLYGTPASFAARAAGWVSNPGFQDAKRTGKLAWGDIMTDRSDPMVNAFQPFATPGGTRMLVLTTRVRDVTSVAAGALKATGTTAYLIDANERVLVAPDATPAGTVMPDAGLLSVLRADKAVETGDRYVAARAVSGSSWRIVTTASKATVLQSVRSTARVGWVLFAAFTAAIITILFVGAVVLTGASRLAHARLHDTLTELPGRALFMQQAEEVLAEQRRRGRTSVAALFLDLDGFKPVNDTYGHSTGDALLKQVAQRLRAGVRGHDLVCRFGGDEFLVLCSDLESPADVDAVAGHILKSLSEPYEIDGRTVTIGTSIGIAVPADPAQPAGALFHDADVALYQAKEAGRGRIVHFRAAPASAPA